MQAKPMQAQLHQHLQDFAPLSAHGAGGAAWSALNLNTGQAIQHNNRRFLAASTIKIPVLMYYAQHRLRSEFQTPYRWQAADHVEDSPFFEQGQTGQTITWDTLAEWMMILSDNAATNLILKTLGLSSIQDWLSDKAPHTTIARLMMDAEARVAGRENWTTPQDMLQIMQHLVQNTWLSAAESQWTLDILHRCQDPEKIPYLFRSPVLVANKPGELPGLRADVGYVHDAQNQVLLAIFCDGITEANEVDCDLWQAQLAQYLWKELISCA